jgi:hypothetical protein
VFFNKIDYKTEILKAAYEKNFDQVEKLAKSAFTKTATNEELLAFICGTIYENKVWNAMTLINKFVERFPNSLHAMRIYLSDLYARQNNFDAATLEARIYLRVAKDCGVLYNSKNKLLDYAIGHGFLLLTSIYTAVGARSYSKKILEIGFAVVSRHWQNIYETELKSIEKELEDKNNNALNLKWESFFSRGENFSYLVNLLNTFEAKELTMRTELLADNFRFNDSFQIDEKELFQLIYTSKNGVKVLC